MEEGKDCSVVNSGNLLRALLPQRLIFLMAIFLFVCWAFSVVGIYTIQRFGVETMIASASPSLEHCVVAAPPDTNGLERWIKPPSTLLHSMTDEELFWRATLVPRVNKYPFSRTPKIAFMFLSKGPLPLAPLWERFFKGQDEGLYSIYIHSSPSFQPNFTSTSVFYGRQIPSQVAEWGKMSMCDAERRLLANALLDISNEWFILLSESCIPLHNFTYVYHYIKKSRHSFVGAFDELGPVGRGRYNPRMAPEVNLTDWRKGSQWFETNRKLAVRIVQDTAYYPKFAEFCKPTCFSPKLCKPPCYVDEHYFSTMLTIQSAEQLANRTLTWVDWSRRGPHPETFGRENITEDFMTRFYEGQNCSYNDKPSSVCYLFARKFAPSALESLLLVAPKYLGF